MKQISVIIASWNACELLRACLKSLGESGGPLIREIIVVDNASGDGSADMVAHEFPGASLIRAASNLGFARANNLGLQQASGSLLALINSDVVVHPGCFDRLAAVLTEDAGIGLVGPKVVGHDGQLQRTCRRLPTLWNTVCRSLALDGLLCRWHLFSGREMRHWDQANRAEVEVVSGCFWLARREAVEQVGGLDERFFFYAEDVDWCKRFWDAGWKIIYEPAATVTHFGGGSSANAPLRYSIEMLRANLTYWQKHYGLWGQGLFYVLSVLHHGLRFLVRSPGRLAVWRSGAKGDYEYKRSWACLRWLLSGCPSTVPDSDARV